MKPLLSLVFLLTVLMAHAAELPWFDINCNLRKADYVLEGKIIDDKGKIEITHDYSQVKLKETVIQIDQFASAENFKISGIDSSLVGHSIVIFVKKDTLQGKFFPVGGYWELSTLWIDEEAYNGAIQNSTISDWELATYYKSRIEFEIVLKNWEIFNQAFIHFKNYESPENRVYYLYTIFNWHPFKTEIIEEIKKEKEIAPQFLENMAWNLLHQRLPAKQEICPCNWWRKIWFKNIYEYKEYESRGYVLENIYLDLFSAYKEVASNDKEDGLAIFLDAVKYGMSTMMKSQWSSEYNEEFILEFIKFMNANPTDGWEGQKVILREIVTTNASHYSEAFTKKLTEILK
ncbi:MAG: hypothetical protein HUU01_01595 [Saprospiraceae bacterium]|nr:hypothetical protein [Saprospiraceae bacterium]